VIVKATMVAEEADQRGEETARLGAV